MHQAIERAQIGDLKGGHLWLAIATELRAGTVPVVMSGQGKGYETEPEPVPVRIGLVPDGQIAYMPVPEPAYRRAETEVLQRIPDESTPAYEAAGEFLDDTRAIPVGIAHPLAESVGPNSTCVTKGCGLDVVWIKGRGWVHDVNGYPVSCERAEAATDEGR